MTIVRPSLHIIIDQPKGQIVSILPISDKIMNLDIISCDLCNVRKASFDVFINGVIKGIPALKRCCDICIKSI